MISVKNARELRVFVTEDDTLLSDIQTAFPSPPYTIYTTSLADPGALASRDEIYSAKSRLLRLRLKNVRTDLEEALSDATSVPEIKSAAKDLFDLIFSLFFLMAE